MNEQTIRDIDFFLPLPPGLVELEEIYNSKINPYHAIGYLLYHMDEKKYYYLTNQLILNSICRVHEYVYWDYCMKQDYDVLVMDDSHQFYVFRVLDMVGSMSRGRHTEQGYEVRFDIIDLPMSLSKPYD